MNNLSLSLSDYPLIIETWISAFYLDFVILSLGLLVLAYLIPYKKALVCTGVYCVLVIIASSILGGRQYNNGISWLKENPDGIIIQSYLDSVPYQISYFQGLMPVTEHTQENLKFVKDAHLLDKSGKPAIGYVLTNSDLYSCPLKILSYKKTWARQSMFISPHCTVENFNRDIDPDEMALVMKNQKDIIYRVDGVRFLIGLGLYYDVKHAQETSEKAKAQKEKDALSKTKADFEDSLSHH